MKAVAYSVQAFEKEYFAKANNKKHDITLIANPLDMDTIHYARGKGAVIMPKSYTAPDEVLQTLHSMGISYIITRNTITKTTGLQNMAEQMIKELDSVNDKSSPFDGNAL